MNRIISAVFIASALIFGVFLPSEKAVAQTAKQLVGTWTLVSITLEKDGTKTDMYGRNPTSIPRSGTEGSKSAPQPTTEPVMIPIISIVTIDR